MIQFLNRVSVLSLMLAVFGFLLPGEASAGGTWAPLASGPPAGVNNCLLLSDGTVLGMSGVSQCVKLTPDIHGSYVHGTWTSLPAMNYSRLFFSSVVLTNGNVYAAGGEYGNAGGHAELYDTVANTWTLIPPSGLFFSDACSKMLPNGNVLQSDSQSGIYLYNAVSNIITAAGTIGTGDMNESCWVRMPNDNILAVTGYSQTSQHYVPALNAWYADNNVPVPVFGYAGELGPALVLPNGTVFQIGATTNTAIYTPGSSLTGAGTWVAGAGMLFPLVTNTANSSQVYGGALGAVDAPAAMMVNGNILCALGVASGFNGTEFYEYNYLSNSFTQVSAPYGNGPYGWDGNATFGTSMLDLPDGTVLFMDGQNTGSLYVYTPDGSPLAAGQPVINSITENPNGTYHLTGIGLNGISGGAAYGDDEQMDSNYPLVRMTNSVTGNVYYARTYQWSSTTIQNPNPVTTEFSLPANLPPGSYSLIVVANGNPSAPTNFVYAPPTAPTGLTGTAGNAQTILSWNSVSGATTYNLKRLTTTSPPYYATVATVTGTNCTNAGLVNAFTYSYVVTAVGAGGESANSATLMLTPSGPPPVPAGVTATSATFARIDLAWNASYGAVSYEVSRSTTITGPYTNLTSSLNPFYTDSGLVDGATYYYVVSAVSAEGTSSNSAPVSATAQAIVNFSFEVPNAGSGNYIYTPTNAFWNFSGTSNGYGSGLVANGSGFGNPNAPDGVQAAFVQSNGVISQIISGFIPGTNYTVTFRAAERPGNAQTWNVTINGTVIASYNPGSGATSYATYTATFTATAATETLAFVGTDLAGGDNTIFVDDVQIVKGAFVNTPNFGFETPGISGYEYNPSGGSWTFSASPNGSGIIANGSGFGNPNTPQGVQAAFVQEHGTITQSISGFTPGAVYQITFEAAQRPGNAQTWNVTMNGAVIASYNPGSSATSYTSYTATFTATAATEILEFIGTDLAGGDNTIFLDNITIAQPIQPVNPVVTLTTPTNNASFIGLPVISLAASVATNGNVINSAQFYYNATNLIGLVTNLPFSYGWTNPNTGSYGVFARLTYNDGSVADSTAAEVTVINTNVNFGFETPGIGSGNYRYGPSSACWTFSGTSGNGSGLVANGSGFGNPNALQGVQAAFLQSYGSISQRLYRFTPGTTYTITYSAAQRGGASQHGGESWNVMIDNSVIATSNPGGTGYAAYNASFTASAFAHTLSFVGTDLATGDNSVFLDNVSISPPVSQVPPLVVLASPANNAVLSGTNPVNLAAAVFTNGNSIVGVQFYSGSSNLIAQVTTPYTYAWSNANAGASTVFARLVFNGSNTVDSSIINITVTNPPPVTVGIGFSADGFSLSLQGIGLPNRPYYLDTASNLNLPAVWTTLLTNISDASGNILYTNLAPTNFQQFFRLSAP